LPSVRPSGARIVDAEGEYLGDTVLPAGVTPGLDTRIIGDLLLALVKDKDTGEPVPTVYRMRSAALGSP
jgi:hypothetical protein